MESEERMKKQESKARKALAFIDVSRAVKVEKKGYETESGLKGVRIGLVEKLRFRKEKRIQARINVSERESRQRRSMRNRLKTVDSDLLFSEPAEPVEGEGR